MLFYSSHEKTPNCHLSCIVHLLSCIVHLVYLCSCWRTKGCSAKLDRKSTDDGWTEGATANHCRQFWAYMRLVSTQGNICYYRMLYHAGADLANCRFCCRIIAICAIMRDFFISFFSISLFIHSWVMSFSSELELLVGVGSYVLRILFHRCWVWLWAFSVVLCQQLSCHFFILFLRHMVRQRNTERLGVKWGVALELGTPKWFYCFDSEFWKQLSHTERFNLIPVIPMFVF